MADVPPALPATGCVRNRDPRHVANWYRLEGGYPWVCHLCHPNPRGASLHVDQLAARRVVQITLEQAARFVGRPPGQERALMPP